MASLVLIFIVVLVSNTTIGRINIVFQYLVYH